MSNQTNAGPRASSAPIVWVGPFGVAENGISDYSDRIAENWRGRLDVSMLKLHFSNWQRD